MESKPKSGAGNFFQQPSTIKGGGGTSNHQGEKKENQGALNALQQIFTGSRAM